MSVRGKSLAGGGNQHLLSPASTAWGGRRAKLLPLKSRRRGKSEGLRDVPAADKGVWRRGGSKELAPRLLAGLPWILC